MYLLIKCFEDGDTYQTFSDLKEAKKVFKDEKKSKFYHYLVLCEIHPNRIFGFGDYGFEGIEAILEWSRDYGDQ